MHQTHAYLESNMRETESQFIQQLCTFDPSKVKIRQCQRQPNSSFNSFKPNVISKSYQYDQSISILRVIWIVFFIFIQIQVEHSVSKQWRPGSDNAFSSGSTLFAYIPQKGRLAKQRNQRKELLIQRQSDLKNFLVAALYCSTFVGNINV